MGFGQGCCNLHRMMPVSRSTSTDYLPRIHSPKSHCSAARRSISQQRTLFSLGLTLHVDITWFSLKKLHSPLSYVITSSTMEPMDFHHWFGFASGPKKWNNNKQHTCHIHPTFTIWFILWFPFGMLSPPIPAILFQPQTIFDSVELSPSMSQRFSSPFAMEDSESHGLKN